MNTPQIVPSDAAQAILPAAPESQLTARPDPLLSLFEKLARRAPTGMTLSIASLGLAACGGNGDGGGGGQTDQIGGVALKGLLEGAFAFADYDGDGIWDQGTEPGQLTDENGEFQLDVTVEGAQIVVTTDENTIDGSTGLATPGITLKAPTGSSVISPLTTLVVETGLTPAQIAANLGLPQGVDLLTFNPFAAGADQAAALAVEKSSHMVMGTIRAIAAALESGGIDPSEAYRLAAAAVTSAVSSANANQPLDFTDAATTGSILNTAASEAVGLPDGFVDQYSAAITNAIVSANSAVQSATSLSDQAAFSGPSNLVNAINESDIDDLEDALSGSIFSKVEDGDEVSFAGNATGPITVSLENNTATFSRGGVSVTVADVSTKTIALAEGQTLSVDLATYQALGSTDGDGTVEITVTDGKTYEIAASSKFWVLPEGMDNAAAQTFFDALSEGDVVYMPSGRHDFDVTLNVDNVTLLGANFGEAVHGLSDDESFVGVYETELAGVDREDIAQEIRDDLVKFDTSASPRDLDESWISGKITVAASGVTLHGLRLHNAEGGLGFSATGDANIDDFTLLNSYLTGHAAGSISFADADYVLDQESGEMTGEASSGWRIEGNLIGGVSTSSSNGGSLYLTGLADSSISGNVFWRPGAAHLYLEDLASVTLENNFFYHGMHAGGANFDGLLGGVGSGYGYGYGYGYGTDTGYGYGYGGSGSGYGYGYGTDTGYGGSGSGYGYGYGNDSGYGGSGSGYGYGYGTDSGYGYGYGGYGYGGNGGSGPFFGRNYWLELKGVNDGVTFSDNLGLFNSGGIQVWDEGSTLNNFSDITISGNTFALSINADPSGYLDSISGTSRHKSGIMGGVVWSTEDESASSGLVIDGNLIEGDIGQLLNDGDIRSLILIQGGVDGVEIEGNTLSWDWLTREGSVPPGATAGIMLSRTLIDRDFDPNQFVVNIDGNTFSHPGIGDLPSGYSWAGVYLDVTSPDLNFEDMVQLGLDNEFEISPVDASLGTLVGQDGYSQLTSLINAGLIPYGFAEEPLDIQQTHNGNALVFSF
jgi:hypothetical protein